MKGTMIVSVVVAVAVLSVALVVLLTVLIKNVVVDGNRVMLTEMSCNGFEVPA